MLFRSVQAPTGSCSSVGTRYCNRIENIAMDVERGLMLLLRVVNLSLCSLGNRFKMVSRAGKRPARGDQEVQRSGRYLMCSAAHRG